MVEWHGTFLVSLGAWLLIYRAFTMNKLSRAIAEPFTTVVVGLTFILLAPLLSWPPAGYGVAMLGVLGVMLSRCHPAMTAFVVTCSLAAAVGGFVWRLSLCATAPELLGMSVHPILMTVLFIIFILLFVCIPGTAGPVPLVFCLVPALGALLVVLGLSELYPDAGGVTASALLSPSAFCDAAAAAASDDGAGGATAPLVQSRAAKALAAWLAVTVVGALLQFLVARLMRRQAEDDDDDGGGRSGPGGALVQSLLPNAQSQEEGGANLPRPSDGGDRYQLIAKAIYLPPEADLSHLSENERKIVAICREDEFERDRLLWGGGLI